MLSSAVELFCLLLVSLFCGRYILWSIFIVGVILFVARYKLEYMEVFL